MFQACSSNASFTILHYLSLHATLHYPSLVMRPSICVQMQVASSLDIDRVRHLLSSTRPCHLHVSQPPQLNKSIVISMTIVHFRSWAVLELTRRNKHGVQTRGQGWEKKLKTEMTTLIIHGQNCVKKEKSLRIKRIL